MGPSTAARQARGLSAAARKARGLSAAARQARGPKNGEKCKFFAIFGRKFFRGLKRVVEVPRFFTFLTPGGGVIRFYTRKLPGPQFVCPLRQIIECCKFTLS